MASTIGAVAGHLNSGWTYWDRVPVDADGLTVLEFYATRYRHSSRAAWQQRLSAGRVRLDGRVVQPGAVLAPGQKLQYCRPPWREADVPRSFHILYEDADLLIVDKPGGLPCMPGGNFLDNTLLRLVRMRHGHDWAPLHRLGRATSGIVLFACSARARRKLSADLRSGRVRKVYRALVDGADIEAERTIDVPIGLIEYAPLGRLYAAVSEGKPSRSIVRVLERRPEPDRALVEVEIPTGRPHQIRIHLAAVGHPLTGDPLYVAGGRPRSHSRGERAPLPGDGGYHLHAGRMDLVHPGDQQVLTVTAAPPSALCRAVD